MYPFGQLLPGRHKSSPAYRYGFQGQEKDDEIKGEGNSLNYTFRMHDPRVGRFFAVDPLTAKYPHYTPYSFSGNKLIAFVELEGLEESRINATIDWNTAVKLSGKDATSAEVLKKYNAIHFAGSKQLAVGTFKLPFPSGGAARDLIDHYAYGEGKPLKFSKKQMLEVYPLVTPDGSSVDLSLSTIDFASAGKLGEKDSYNFSKSVQVYSGTSGTLGVNTVTVEGKITYNPKTETKEFIGSVKFSDTYDFNKSTHRDFIAEGQTTIARNFLPGTPFEVSGSLPVRQSENGKILLNDGSGTSPTAYEKPKTSAVGGDAKTEGGDVGN